MALYSQHNTIYGWFPPPFPDGYKNIPGCKKLSVFRHLHKPDQKFNHRLYFVFWARLGDIGKVLKTEIEFNYKLYFYSNIFNNCIQKQNTTRGWTCPLFSGMYRKMSGAQKNCLHFITRIKCVLYLIIGCIHRVIQPVVEYSRYFMVFVRIYNI